ncbi:AMP-binding protein [Nodosilinea sp. LEGE 07088]|uniref:AMP-binding protein n=1 Tax=Nodosilinea sp. LEGE 07088 TaxID=2777968 RepID=UPI00187E3BF7|nr:AMP-binding protein [Nodosilinea sp. LEGE 07088]MBE9136129.1 AMP-binding protein [Nodosilinea sp. LEGE 07088]
MGQTLGDVLGDRRGDDWLIGLSSSEFWQRLDQLTPQFVAYRAGHQGDGAGVLIADPNPLQFLVACLAAWDAGCAVVLANPGWGQWEWQQVQTMVAGRRDAPLAPGLGAYPCHVSGGNPDQILIPSGGASGQIKFAAHTWDTLMVSIQGFVAHFGVEPVHAYCVLPLFHVSGLMQALRVFATGGCLALQAYRELKAEGPLPLPAEGFLSLVPTQLQELLTLGGEFIPWLRSFRAVLLGGAPAWRSLLDQAQAAKIPVALTYGMTETAAQIATLRPEEFLVGHRSSGRPLPHVNLVILNDQNHPQPSGQPGKIVVHAASLAQGYLKSQAIAPAASSLTTDDVGYLDDDGYLHVIGRSSSKLVTGGENVFPEEVEAVLLSLEGVSDVCVVGLPCDRWGQQLCALVVAESPMLLRTLQQALKPLVAAYKLPKQWILVDALPRTAQGKLSRSRALALAKWILDIKSRLL